jgi:amidophosphoribosyltransferase
MAIGHTRYSTTGDSALLNAQPIRVDSTKGLIAIAHNGNLVNLGNIRARLERDGAYFQTTADSEIIVQLIAHSKANACGRDRRLAGQVEGAFSIVMMTRDRIFAARDPRGFRPLSMGASRTPMARTRLYLPARPARSTCSAPNTCAMCCPANWSW